EAGSGCRRRWWVGCPERRPRRARRVRGKGRSPLCPRGHRRFPRSVWGRWSGYSWERGAAKGWRSVLVAAGAWGRRWVVAGGGRTRRGGGRCLWRRVRRCLGGCFRGCVRRRRRGRWAGRAGRGRWAGRAGRGRWIGGVVGGCFRRRRLTHVDVPRGGRIERLLGRGTAVLLVLERIGEGGRDLARLLRCPADRADLGLIARGQRGVFEPVRSEPGGVDVQGQQADGGVTDVGRGQGVGTGVLLRLDAGLGLGEAQLDRIGRLVRREGFGVRRGCDQGHEGGTDEGGTQDRERRTLSGA